MLCLHYSGVVALLIFALFASNTKAQSVARASSTCESIASDYFSRARASSIAQVLASGFGSQASADSFCQTSSRGGSPRRALRNAYDAFRLGFESGADTDCTYAVAIAVCSSSAQAGDTLSLADSQAIAQSFGNGQAIAICESFAEANSAGSTRRAEAQAGAEALLRACSIYGPPPDSAFVQSSARALSEIGNFGQAQANSFAQALYNSGNDLAMAAAKACGRALGLTDSAIEAAAQATSSASLPLSRGGLLGNDLSASAGSSASVQTGNRLSGIASRLGISGISSIQDLYDRLGLGQRRRIGRRRGLGRGLGRRLRPRRLPGLSAYLH